MSRSYIFCMFVKVFPKGIQNLSEIISFKALGQITNSSNIMANLKAYLFSKVGQRLNTMLYFGRFEKVFPLGMYMTVKFQV